MSTHFDALETRDATVREAAQIDALQKTVAAALAIPAWRAHLGDVDPLSLDSRAALARLPVLRKSDLPALQKTQKPFAGLVPGRPGDWRRLMMSPGPIFEPESHETDPWRIARAMHAAGFAPGDVMLNTFSYHLTPGAWCFDGGARRIGCAVIPAGPGNSEAQLDLIEAYRPDAYTGTPDFLKILLDAAAEKGRDASSIRRALVSGAAFPPSLQRELAGRGVDAYQCYATAECGIIAYETPAREGLVLDEGVIVELVRPGSGDPVPEGDVGEVVVTVLDPAKPLIRLAVGDLSAFMTGVSPCGRTNARIRGWMGRADQTAKVKGMFVRPEQVSALMARHPEIARARLVITREGEMDAMALIVEGAPDDPAFAAALGESARAIFKLGATVQCVAAGAIPRDGKVIEDRRPV